MGWRWLLALVAVAWAVVVGRAVLEVGPGTAQDAVHASWAAALALGALAFLAARGPVRDGRGLRLALGAGGALLCAGLVWAFGHLQFGGFDHGALVDLAWRRAAGQRPFTDFPSTTPIGFVLGAGYSFQLFGASWSAIVGIQALFAAGTFAWSYALLHRLTGAPVGAALLALAVQACASVVVSYWWYNPLTSVACGVFFLSAVLFLRAPEDRAVGASYVASLALAASMKPNVAGLLLPGVTLVLLTSRPHRLRTLAYSAGAFALFAGWLALERLSVVEVVQGYLSVSRRGLGLGQFLQDLTPDEKRVGLTLLALCAAPFFLTRASGGRGRALATVGLLAGVAGFLTNGENKLVDLPLVFLAAWSVASAWTPPVAALAAVLVVQGVTVGALRDRVRSIGPGVFFESLVTGRQHASPFFRGLRSGAALVEAEAEIAALLAARRPATVFFGPRMQWAYAAFGRPSPVGEPVWWHGGVSYPAEREAELVARWVADRPQLLIFLRGDFTYLPGPLGEVISRDYQLVGGYPILTVFDRVR